MVFAPVGLAELEKLELTWRAEVVAEVENRDLSRLLIDSACRPVLEMLHEEGLQSGRRLLVKLDLRADLGGNLTVGDNLDL